MLLPFLDRIDYRPAANAEAGQLIFDPRLIVESRVGESAGKQRADTSAELSRHSVVGLCKDLTRGLVFEHVWARS